MGTIIIIAVLVVLVYCIRGSFAHLRAKAAAVAVAAVSQSKKRKSWLVKSLLPRLSVLKHAL